MQGFQRSGWSSKIYSLGKSRLKTGRSETGGSACAKPIHILDKQLDRFNCPVSLYLRLKIVIVPQD